MTEQDKEIQELRREIKKLKEQIVMLEDNTIEDIDIAEDWFKNNEEEFVNYLNKLRELNSDNINNRIEQIFERMGRCPRCGSKFDVMYYREYHPEVNAFEPMSDIYCPNCDIGW